MFGSLLAGLGNGLFGAAKTTLQSVFGALVGFTTNLFRGLFSRLLSLFAALPGQLFGVVRTITSLFGGALKGALLATAAALALVTTAAARGVQALTQFGRSAAYLSASTGLDAGASARLQRGLGVAGLDAGELYAGQNPALFGMRAAAFGVPSFTDPDFLARAASRFQNLNAGGLVGQQLAQTMARSLGLNSPEGLRALNTPAGEIRRDAAFGRRTDAALGLDPARFVAFSRAWDSFTNRLQHFGQGVLLRLGQAILPRLQRGFESFLAFAERTAGGIGPLIDRAVETTFNAFSQLAQFLIREAPSAVLSFSAVVLRGLLAVSEAAPSVFSGLMKALDVLQAVAVPAWDWLRQAIPSAFQMLVAGVQEFGRQIPVIQAGISGLIGSVLNNPAIASVLGMAGINTGGASGGGGSEGGGAEPSGGGGISPALLLGGGGLVAQSLIQATLAGPAGFAGLGSVAQFALRALSQPLTLGAVAGGTIYNAIRPEGAPGAMEAAGNAWARARNFLTGAPMDLNVTESNGYTRQENARREQAAANDPMAMLRRSFESIRDAAMSSGGTTVRAGIAGAVTPSPFGALMGNIPQGSWSGRLRGYEDDVSRLSGNSSESIRQMLASIEAMQGNLSNNSDLMQLFQRIEANTAQTAQVLGAQSNREDDMRFARELAQIVGQNLSSKARGEFIRVFQR